MSLPDRLRKLTPTQLARAAEWVDAGRLQPAPSADPGEQVWRLALPSGSAVEVRYWPADRDGECSCGADACLHLAAVHQAQGRPIPAPPPAPAGSLGAGSAGAAGAARATDKTSVARVEPIRYRLIRLPNEQLGLDWADAPGALWLSEDQEIRRRMAGWRGQPLPSFFARDLLPLLRGRPLRIDPARPAPATSAKVGDPAPWHGEIAAAVDATGPVLRVEDRGDKIFVRLVRPPGIDEAFKGGVDPGSGFLVRMGPQLRWFRRPEMPAQRYESLREGVGYGGIDIQRLAVEILPGLRQQYGLPVDVQTKRLPEVATAEARLEIEVEAEADRLRIAPQIVYAGAAGVEATVQGGALVSRRGRVVARDTEAEKRLRERLHAQSLGALSLSAPTERSGLAALRLLDGLDRGLREQILARAPAFRRIEAPMALSIAVSDASVARSGAPQAGGAAGTAGATEPAWRLRVEGSPVAPDRLIAAWRAGESLIQTPTGWQEIPREWLDKHGAALAELLSASDGSGLVRAAAAPLLLTALEALDAPAPPSLDPVRAMLGDFRAIPVAPAGPGFLGALRPYQQQGLSWLAWLRSVEMGGVLADDMGLGKTVQCLALMSRHLGSARHLVVAPTSVLRNWAQEAARFLPGARVCVYYGPDRALDPAADLTLTTYALLRLDQEILTAPRWSVIVLDEAQAIKNPDTQAARAAYALQGELRLAVSGTPIENRLEELWSAFHFACPGLLGGRAAFRERFEQPIAAGYREARDALRRRIRPFLLRRVKAEVARDLPPRTEIVLRCALSEDERATYQAAASLSRADIARMLEANRTLSVLEVLLRMRQAACHPGLIRADHAGSSSKLDLLCDTLEEILAEGHCALVFSQWTSLLDRVEPQLRARGIGFCRLDGATRDRAAVVAQFSAEDGPPVFLLSLKAGGTGLNLTRADYVFHLDPWWNPAAEDQATDRAHRIGQQRPVISCRLIAEDTVEEKILALQERKRDLVRAAIDDAEVARALTRDDLLGLF